MTKAKKEAINDLVTKKTPAWLFTYRAPARPGAMDAFNLPSVELGHLRPAKRRIPDPSAQVL